MELGEAGDEVVVRCISTEYWVCGGAAARACSASLGSIEDVLGLCLPGVTATLLVALVALRGVCPR